MVLDIILGVLVVLLAIAYIYQLKVTKKHSEDSADLLRDYQRRAGAGLATGEQPVAVGATASQVLDNGNG